VLVGDRLNEILHKNKSPTNFVGPIENTAFDFGGNLAFFRLVASGPKSIQRL
jgi:hypothetical protein